MAIPTRRSWKVLKLDASGANTFCRFGRTQQQNLCMNVSAQHLCNKYAKLKWLA